MDIHTAAKIILIFLRKKKIFLRREFEFPSKENEISSEPKNARQAKNRIISCAVTTRKNMDNGYTVA